MQEKNDLDAMTKKYKEEMMRIYNQNRASAENTADEAAKPVAVSAKPVSAAVETVMQKASASEEMSENRAEMSAAKNDTSEKQNISEADKLRLMRPPMPEIPVMSGSSSCVKYSGTEKTQERENTSRDLSNPPMPKIPVQSGENAEYSDKPKFPTAEELIRLDSESSVPESAEQMQDARFEPVPRDGHTQGNYDFPVLPDSEYKKETEDFAGYDDDELFFVAQGYLQVEVSGDNGEPVDSAAIVVTERAGDMDTLIVTLVTDSEGKTEVIALPIPQNTEHNGKNQGDYMITVYKEGYYTVYNLPVPIFDTIKSIQPVTVNSVENKR